MHRNAKYLGYAFAGKFLGKPYDNKRFDLTTKNY